MLSSTLDVMMAALIFVFLCGIISIVIGCIVLLVNGIVEAVENFRRK